MTLDLPRLLASTVDVVHAAGDVIRGFDGPVPRRDPTMKGLRDPVTEADLASERLLVERLRGVLPEAAVFAEETTRESTDGLVWYIDPLDGTVNFSQAHPFFSVSVALYDGPEPLLGVVHAPRLGETFAAARGHGTTLNGEVVRVSARERLIDSVLATGFGYRRHELADDNIDHFARLVLQVRGLRRGGSAALDLAYTCCGRLDGFWEPHLNAFDLAAGALLVREAGGVVSDMTGGDDWLHGKHICAAGPALHGPLLAALAEADVLIGRDVTPETLKSATTPEGDS